MNSPTFLAIPLMDSCIYLVLANVDLAASVRWPAVGGRLDMPSGRISRNMQTNLFTSALVTCSFAASRVELSIPSIISNHPSARQKHQTLMDNSLLVRLSRTTRIPRFIMRMIWADGAVRPDPHSSWISAIKSADSSTDSPDLAETRVIRSAESSWATVDRWPSSKALSSPFWNGCLTLIAF